LGDEGDQIVRLELTEGLVGVEALQPPVRGSRDRRCHHLGAFLTGTWLPQKRRHVRATTAYRYTWFVERYVNPAIGAIPLRRLRSDHLDTLYESLATAGGRSGAGLAPKTILEVHMIVCAALDIAMDRAAQRRPRIPLPAPTARRPHRPRMEPR
jgi:hypothetical protein